MKIFSLIAVLIGLISTIFNIIDRDFLMILSSISMSLAFAFLFYYYKNKSEKFMNLFAVFLVIYSIISLIRMFTEKGYF
jgi:uncharacterized membrane protein HdeD (DUF308 family)